MDVTLNIWGLAGVIIISILIGYWAGRLALERDSGEEEEIPSVPGRRIGPETDFIHTADSRNPGEPERAYEAPQADETKKAAQGRRVPGEKRIPLGWAIGSPVAGEVNFFYEGARRGAVIKPEQEMLYAPAPGKITRLYPAGRAFRLRTDYGVELLIQAGLGTDELEGRYFRPRVVQNEIVGKGKLLLEFDKAGIEAEGGDSSVLMSVEDADNYRDILVTDVQRVKTGEDLLWVRR